MCSAYSGARQTCADDVHPYHHHPQWGGSAEVGAARAEVSLLFLVERSVCLRE